VGWFFEKEVVQIGKGSKPRPRSTTREEEELRWKLATGHIKFDEFERRYKKLMEEGKIQRNGRVINE